MLATLAGSKTYIMAAGGAVVTILYAFGLISTDLWTTLMGLLGFGGLAALRSAMTAENKAERDRQP